VPLLLREETSTRYRKSARDEPIVTWWGSLVECTAAIERRARLGETPEAVATAYRNLTELFPQWREIYPTDKLRRAAVRLVRTAGVRTGDALHLAAATVASNFEPGTVQFLTEDLRLKVAAEREGFVVD